jgi:hypothetical protein
MKTRHAIVGISTTLLAATLTLSHPLVTTAQEPASKKEAPEGSMGMHGKMGKKQPGMKAKMYRHHEKLAAMHKAMMEELQQQLTALREHSKTMDGITDEAQLLSELKKHQQMTDELIGTMVEQRQKIYTRMREHHERMRSHREQMQPPPGQSSGAGDPPVSIPQTEEKEAEGHEAHHNGE